MFPRFSQPCLTVLCSAVQRADEYADPKGDVLLTAQQGLLQWGLWVNTQKNPRFKLVELSGLGMTVEIPKQLALANIALRVQVMPFAVLHGGMMCSRQPCCQTGIQCRACMVPQCHTVSAAEPKAHL
jgi:hypothetical protein